ncbi:MAG: hypothetical protein IPF92_24920 [Myxococcales bacterium]|nr:hypothetical protein [Myxococcales bacterium]MBL0195833.1 hypothetical protein [Myxococcales bacterium]
MSDRLRAAYDALKARARARAGRPGDIAQRVMEHHAIYQDSRGNHAFPLIALHGALWGYNFFETTGKLGEIISYRYFLDAEEKATRHAMLNAFAEGFKAVNREVFIDTYTNWYFTREHGRERGAEALVNGALLEALNEAHAARAAGRELDLTRKRHLFVQALHFEQELTVAPGIARELAKFDCPILRALCMKPLVRFEYFPFWRTFSFSDFSNKEERVERALESFDLAAEQGWEAVRESMRDYGVLPDTFFAPATAG